MKICNECKNELPSDSEFCQYCGSNNISDIIEQSHTKPFKRCIDCGKELPIDSDFCQYCGSKRVALINSDIKSDFKHGPAKKEQAKNEGEKNYKVPFIITLIIAACLLCSTFYYYSIYQQTADEFETSNLRVISLEKEVQTQKNTANRYKAKSDNYDVIKRKAMNKNDGDFFASQTVLKHPVNDRVVFYIPYYGDYTISFNYSSNNIYAEARNTASGLVCLDITYTGDGVEYIECTNNVNDSKIVIYCIGG